MTGRLITVEGLDGAGKSTLIGGLDSALEGDNLCLREPGGTAFADAVASLVRGHSSFLPEPESDRARGLLERWREEGEELDARGELLIFNAARADLIDLVLLPALEDGRTVLLDRFYDSTIAYQGYGRGLDIDSVKAVCSEASQGLRPDVTFYLSISPEERSARLSARSLDRIEASGDDFYLRVAEGFEELCQEEPERFYTLAAEQSPEDLVARALERI